MEIPCCFCFYIGRLTFQSFRKFRLLNRARSIMCNVISRNLRAASRMMSSCAKLIELDKLSADSNILDECQDDKQFNGWPVPKCLYDWKIQACLPSIGGATKPPGHLARASFWLGQMCGHWVAAIWRQLMPRMESRRALKGGYWRWDKFPRGLRHFEFKSEQSTCLLASMFPGFSILRKVPKQNLKSFSFVFATYWTSF